jgi:hypothetical protein
MNTKYIDGIEYRETDCRSGFYVSRFADVRGLRGGTLAPRMSSGRLKVNLHSNKCTPRTLKKAVGDFVLTAFDRPRRPGEVVRHLNGDASACSLSNIEWSTDEQNRADERGRPRPKRLGRQLYEHEVRDIKRLLYAGWSQSKVAEFYGVSRTCISGIATGYRWSHIHIEVGA